MLFQFTARNKLNLGRAVPIFLTNNNVKLEQNQTSRLTPWTGSGRTSVLLFQLEHEENQRRAG